MTLQASAYTPEILKTDLGQNNEMMFRMLFTTPKRAAILLTSALALVIGVLALAPLSVPQGVPGTDKTHHVIAFAVLVLPVSVLSPRTLIWLLPMAIAYGGLIEIIQPYTGRFGEWKDLWADIVGVIIGAAVGLASRRLLMPLVRRKSLS